MCISKRERSGNLAQINYTYTKASLACASLTVFAPGFQHTSAAACTEHQSENPIVVNVHETLHPGENSSSSNARKRTKDDRSPGVCAAGGLEERGCSQCLPLGQGQPCPAGSQQKEHQQGKGAVGACWYQFPTILHSWASNAGFAPAPLRNHQQAPTPHGLGFFRCRKLRERPSQRRTGRERRAFPKNNYHYFSNNYAITKINSFWKQRYSY